MNLEFYKLLGPLSVGMTGLAIIAMLILWRNDKSMSISQHAAAHKSSYLMMLIVQTISLPMLFLFLAKALTPIAGLPKIFVVFTGFACLGLLIAAWVPEVTGRRGEVHRLAAFSAAALIVPSLTMLYLSPHISSLAKYTALVSLIYVIVAQALFAAATKKAQSDHLYFQAAYIFLFAFSTLVAAYFR